jgi:hypothetical protein
MPSGFRLISRARCHARMSTTGFSVKAARAPGGEQDFLRVADRALDRSRAPADVFRNDAQRAEQPELVLALADAPERRARRWTSRDGFRRRLVAMRRRGQRSNHANRGEPRSARGPSLHRSIVVVTRWLENSRAIHGTTIDSPRRAPASAPVAGQCFACVQARVALGGSPLRAFEITIAQRLDIDHQDE